ncbi:MAG: Dyp-type peroxidase [Actinobacteria bacterium]|nr:Dyp-type peroxidase [Actinomycetota bacterium]
MQPSDPQAVLAPMTAAAVFMVATIDDGGEDAIRELLPDLAALCRTVGSRSPDGRLTLVTGIGAEAWDRLFDGPRPAHLHPFVELRGDVHHAPATPGDLLFHIRAERVDLCFELAMLITERLAGAATVVDEVHGFRYFDDRAMLAFVDGVENPTGRAAVDAVLVADDDPDFAGSSYVIVQKYLHDMDAWNAMAVEAQEVVIGRRKASNLELSDEEKAPGSHNVVTNITDDDGNELKILRENMPFGAPGRGEFGTYFIGYAADPAVTGRMIENMFVGDPRSGATDLILDVSTAVTGSLFAVPTATFLDDPPGPPGTPAAAPEPDPDDSLGIGKLAAD